MLWPACRETAIGLALTNKFSHWQWPTKQQATSNKQQATTNNQQATSDNQQATTNERQPTSNNQQPSYYTARCKSNRMHWTLLLCYCLWISVGEEEQQQQQQWQQAKLARADRVERAKRLVAGYQKKYDIDFYVAGSLPGGCTIHKPLDKFITGFAPC